jgi:hypothetical protein
VSLLLATCLPLWLGSDDVRSRARPALSGPEELVESADGRFLVHFTREGDDAATDDLVASILEGLEAGAQAFEERGYRPLLLDSGLGGTNAIDVYVVDIDGMNGFAYPVQDGEGLEGDSCYVEIDASLKGSPGLVVPSVAAHELHHCIQYTYTDESHPWIYEATATFEQYRLMLDDTLEFAVGVLWGARLSQPDRPMEDRGDRFEYAGFVFVKYWEDRGGSVPDLWEALADEPEWATGVATAADEAFGLSLEAMFLDHAVWNAFACARAADDAHYTDSIPCSVDASVPVAAIEGDSVPFAHTAAPYTSAYASMPSITTEGLTASCSAPAEDAAQGLAILALDVDGALAAEARAVGGPGEAVEVALPGPIPDDGTLVLVSTSTGTAPADVTCSLTRTAPPEPEGCGCRTSSGAGWGALLLAASLVRGRRRFGADGPANRGKSAASVSPSSPRQA